MKTGINFARCNVSTAEMHNTRDPHYIAAVNASPQKHYSLYADKTATNVSWIHPDYANRSLPDILDELREVYKMKTGQAPQEQDRVREIMDKKTGLKKTVTNAGWSPLREGVCPILENTRIDDFAPYIEWLQHKGVHVVRIDLHHDEGYTDELTGIRKYNHHAHIICDWVNHDTGRTAKLTKLDMTEAQTRLAAALGMERGISKTITGADHLTPDQQRAKAAAAKVIELQQQIDNNKKEIQNTSIMVVSAQDLAKTALKNIYSTQQQFGKNTVRRFDQLCNLDAANPTSDDKNNRNKLAQEASYILPNDIHIDDLAAKAASLGNLIIKVTISIERIGNKLQKLAKDIPLFKRHRLAHEAELQAAVETAESNARISDENAQIAIDEAEDTQTKANNALSKAIERENKAKELQDNLLERINNARKQGYQSGAAAKDNEIKNLQETKQSWLKDFYSIGDKLTSFSAESVALFERLGLRDLIGTNIWDEAKEKHHKTTGMKLR